MLLKLCPMGPSASVKFNKVSFSYGRLMYSHDTSLVWITTSHGINSANFQLREDSHLTTSGPIADEDFGQTQRETDISIYRRASPFHGVALENLLAYPSDLEQYYLLVSKYGQFCHDN